MNWKIGIVVMMVAFFAGQVFAGTYGGGKGTEAEPYLIDTPEHMQEIGDNSGDWGSHFKQMADIDLGSYTGTAYNIIGLSWGNHFTGVFDGDDHRISNFTYTSTATDYIGLFGVVGGPNAEIKNLHLVNPDIDAGTGRQVGALIGYVIEEGTVSINNCHVDGGNISGNLDVGGLVGFNGMASIINCSVKCTVTGEDYIGGVVGGNARDIINSRSSSIVSGTSYVGGLVGGSEGGQVINCSSSGEVTGTYWGAGGLAGYDYETSGGGIISNCYSSANVAGVEAVGGLVGSAYDTISNSFATGSVRGTEAVGGLAGDGDGEILQCFAMGDVEGSIKVGGLIGWSWPLRVYDCYAKGNVLGDASVGGLVGVNEDGTMERCYSTGFVTGNNHVGGLVGKNDDGATSCFWDVNTSGQATSAGGTGKTTAEMYDPNTFIDVGWDFVKPIWKVCDLASYPKLWWERCPIAAPVLYSDPEVTLGTDNTLYWEPVDRAEMYYVECFNEPNFVSISLNSDWIYNSEFTFSNLDIGQTYWYRAKARTAPDILTWLQTSQEDFETSTLENIRVDSIPGSVVLAKETALTVTEEVGGTRYNGGRGNPNYITGGRFNFFECTSNCTLKEIRQRMFHYSGNTVQFVVYEAIEQDGQYEKIHSNSVTKGYGVQWSNSHGISVPLIKGRYYAIGVVGKGNLYYYDFGGNNILSWGTRVGSGGSSYPTPDTLSYANSSLHYGQRLTTEIEPDFYPAGNIVASAIDLCEGGSWADLEFSITQPADTNLTVDVLDATDDGVIIADVNDGEDLSWIDVNSIKLRANLSTDDPSITPALHDWSVTYTDPTTIIESDWSNVVWSMQGTLGDAVDVMLDPNSLKNANMANALSNKIDEVLAMIDDGLYEDARAKLENDILKKTDGCVKKGEPDKNDWILTCDEQDEIYQLITETIDYVTSLIE